MARSLLLVGCLGVAAAIGPSPPRPAERRLPGHWRSAHQPVLTAARPTASNGGSADLAIAGKLAGLALASEVVPYANTALLFVVLQRLSGARSMGDLLDQLIGAFGTLGWASYPTYAVLLVALQVVPVCSALVLILLAGALFGPLWGTLLVSVSLSCAAVVCALLTRLVSRRAGYDLSQLSERAAAVDAALATGPVRTPLLLVLLLRLSPVLPFTFSNYLVGLTSMPAWIIFVGTLVGTLPSQAVYVSAGALGRQALQGGLRMPPAVLLLGGAATAAAIWLVGHISQQTLSKIQMAQGL